jgi:hypothetical protein
MESYEQCGQGRSYCSLYTLDNIQVSVPKCKLVDLEWAVMYMYMCVRGIEFASFKDFSIGYIVLLKVALNAITLTLLNHCLFKMCWSCLPVFQPLLSRILCPFNATFNNISVISWRSVFCVEETGVPGENRRPVVSQWQTLPHNVVSSTPRHERDSNSYTRYSTWSSTTWYENLEFNSHSSTIISTSWLSTN